LGAGGRGFKSRHPDVKRVCCGLTSRHPDNPARDVSRLVG